MFTPRFLLIILALALLASHALVPGVAHAQGTTIFVDDSSTCTLACGNTWATAYPQLQDALAAAHVGDQLWVAQGVYYPDEGQGLTDNDRTLSFTLKNGVKLYGGFFGNESTLTQRDPAVNSTILSGDIDKNDGGTIVGNNAYHVVVSNGIDSSAVLDGFLITAGLANGSSQYVNGGGMYNQAASPTLVNLTFRRNAANTYGGGMYNIGGSPSLTNVTFQDNTAQTGGGGMYNQTANPTLANVSFSGNTARFGGGMYNSENSSPTLTNVSFSSNTAQDAGGGIFNYVNSNPMLTNVTFTGNTAQSFGGGMHDTYSSPALTNVTFSGNTAGSGGGMSNLGDSRPRLVNVTFSDNSAQSSGGGMYNDGSAFPRLTNTIIANSSSGGDCDGPVNGASSYNLIEDATRACGLTNGANGNLIGQDPRLDPLANNGGATLTHALQPGYPALDAGAKASCPATDQRGLPRPQGPNCDIGAVERMPTTMPPLPTSQPYYLGRILVRPIALPIFADPPNIAVTQLEVTQAIQEADGAGVTLVAGKRTYVRFHVRQTGSGDDPVVGARLWRIVNGQRMGDPLLPSARPNGFLRFLPFFLDGIRYVFDPTVTVRVNPDRNALEDSFFFRLPDSWTAAGDLTIEAEVNPTFLPNAVEETTRSDNILRATVTFADTPPMVVRLFAVRYRAGGTVYAPSETQLREVEDWLRRAFPIAHLVVIRDVEDMTNLNRLPTCDEVNGRLFWDNLFLKWAGIDPLPTRYYGLVNDGGGFMRGCAADIPSFIASGPTGNAVSYPWDTDSESYGDWYTGHELAHTWGRSHVACSGTEAGPDPNYPMDESGSIGRRNRQNEYWGFDIYLRGPVVYPPTWKDVMTYCNNLWISAYTYEGIRNRLASENQAAAFASPANKTESEYLVVQGTVTPAVPAAMLGPIYHLTAPAVLASSAPGPFAIRLISAGGSVLATYPFTPRIDTEDPEDLSKPLLVMEQVPFVAGAARIQIVTGNSVLAERAISAHAPMVTVTAPAGGETVDDAGLTVSWTADDGDGDALIATVLYSRDGGASYAPLRLHLTGASVVIPLAELGGTTQGKVRVIVSDGVNTSQADSAGFFSVPNRPPTVQMMTPQGNATFGYGQLISLSGAAMDIEDGALPESAYAWYSNQDGFLGNGSSLDADLETIGIHIITLRATDADGASSVVTRTLVLSDDVMIPTARIVVAPIATSFAAVVGSSEVQTQTVSLRNPEASPLAWQASSDAAWLSLGAASGVTPADLELRVNPAGLAAGDYVGVVTITRDGSTESQRVRVTLNVIGPPHRNLYLPLIHQNRR
jgi:hypothetical protein